MLGRTNPEIIATESRMAKIFGFSERKVRDYFKDARVAPAKYDLLLSIKIFVENSSGKDEIAEARKVDTDMKKLKLGILSGEYHHKDDIELLVSDMLARFKAKLTSIPTKASVQLVNVSSRREIEQILKTLVAESLNELSDYSKLKLEDVEIDGAENN